MTLLELQPTFLKIIDHKTYKMVNNIKEADGIRFLCPKCFMDKGEIGTHSVICWNLSVSQEFSPNPGRWNLIGTGYNDLTLQAGSSSIALMGGCFAHFFIQNGMIKMS